MTAALAEASYWRSQYFLELDAGHARGSVILCLVLAGGFVGLLAGVALVRALGAY